MKSGMLKKINTAAAVIVFSTVFAGCAPESKNTSAYENQNAQLSNSNIVGGVNATSDYQKQNGIVELIIGIQDSTGQQGAAICTGTLIAKNLVLTAAHCLAQSGITYIDVLFTTDESLATKADVRFAVRAAVHPDFLKGVNTSDPLNTTAWNDVALLKLDSDAPADFKFSRLPTSMNQVMLVSNSKVTLAGFGISTAIVRRIVRGKKGVQSVVDVPSNTSGILRKIDGIIVKQMSADQKEIILDQSKSIGACHGDSGGPAFVTAKDGSTIQVGITSRGTAALGNCNENAIYTNVAAHLDWISQTSAKLQAPAVATPAPAMPMAAGGVPVIPAKK